MYGTERPTTDPYKAIRGLTGVREVLTTSYEAYSALLKIQAPAIPQPILLMPCGNADNSSYSTSRPSLQQSLRVLQRGCTKSTALLAAGSTTRHRTSGCCEDKFTVSRIIYDFLPLSITHQDEKRVLNVGVVKSDLLKFRRSQ